MSERFNAQDVAVARGLRELEAASDQMLRVSARLMLTVVDAGETRGLPPCANQALLARIGGVVSDVVSLRAAGVDAHVEASRLGVELGLPITAWGDTCQKFFVAAVADDRAAA